MSEELSPAEQKLASELANLATDPDHATRGAIMRAVMQATYPEVSPHWLFRPWRLLAAVAAAVALLATGTVGAFAASRNAVPNSPAYQVRLTGENVRLALADQKDREQLRIDFADERFRQAHEIAHNDRADAQLLLRDGRRYLTQARDDLHALSPNEQEDVQNQLNHAQDAANQAESQVDQPLQPEPSPAVEPDQGSLQPSR